MRVAACLSSAPCSSASRVRTVSLEGGRAAWRGRQAGGGGPAPALAAIVAARWPGAFVRAAQLGYAPRPPSDPEPGRAVWHIEGAAEAGALPLALRVSPAAEPPALLLLLSDRLRRQRGGPRRGLFDRRRRPPPPTPKGQPPDPNP